MINSVSHTLCRKNGYGRTITINPVIANINHTRFVFLLFESNSLPDRRKYIYRQSSSKHLEKDIETAKEIEAAEVWRKPRLWKKAKYIRRY